MKIGVITVATPSHLPYLRALASSIHEHCPQWPIYALILTFDGKPIPLNKDDIFLPVFLKDIGHDHEWPQMAFYYNAYEFCCAMRPFFHSYIYEKTDLDSWIYLDNDMLVYHDLAVIQSEFDDASILLSPHTLEPIINIAADKPLGDAAILLEREQLQCGMFNGGFLGLRRTPAARLFLNWWKDRLQYFCFHQAPYFFLDQMWLNLVPGYFEGVKVFKHPGSNVACWNLHERPLIKNEDNYFVKGYPLLFFHFSGIDPDQPQRIRPYDYIQRLAPSTCLVVKDLALGYRDALIAHGYDGLNKPKYEYGFFMKGQRITPVMRHFYYNLIRDGAVSFSGSPFDQDKFFLKYARGQAWKMMLRRVLKIIFRAAKSLPRSNQGAKNE